MIHVEVRCTTCKVSMICLANIKITKNVNKADYIIKRNLDMKGSEGGIYKCPVCGKQIDLIIEEG